MRSAVSMLPLTSKRIARLKGARSDRNSLIDAALAAIDHFEILFGQVLHKSPFSVPDRCAHGDEIDT